MDDSTVNTNQIENPSSLMEVPSNSSSTSANTTDVDMNNLAASLEASNKLVDHLRAKILTWKNLSSIKQDILNHREREVKNMIRQFKMFEDAISNEKVLRRDLVRRAENAELESIDLTERLNKNVTTLENLRGDYENRIVGLVAELKKANDTCDEAHFKIAELEERVKELEDEKDKGKDNNSSDEDSDGEPKASSNMDGEKWVVPTKSYLRIFSSSAGTTDMVDTIRTLRSQLEESNDKNRILSYQMTLLNSLFMEAEENSIDFDRIRAIGEIVRESMELTKRTSITSLAGNGSDSGTSTSRSSDVRKASFDISTILEKLEASTEKKVDEIPGEESCYKSVDTTAGPKLVLSVSRTFIKLKDLILEKKSLQHEIAGLKKLNDTLAIKVDQQSRRLYRVAGELNKTWRLVSTLKTQHKQLHTSKAVLRYELQEKRKLLEKLKRDLSVSREKWIRVRQKNSESEIEWLKIREEFTKRRQESSHSQESAFFSEADEANTIASSISSISNDDDDSAKKGMESPNTKQSPSPILPHKKLVNTISIEEHAVDTVVELETSTIVPEDPLVLEGACGLDVGEIDDQLDELDDLTEEIKTIEAAAATTDDDAEDEDEEDDTGIFDGTEVNWERLVARRAARLQLLEEQCRALYNNLSTQKAKSVTLASKLAHLHNQFGSDSDDYTTTDPNRPAAEATEEDGDDADEEEEPSESEFKYQDHKLRNRRVDEAATAADVDVDLDNAQIASSSSKIESQDSKDNRPSSTLASLRKCQMPNCDENSIVSSSPSTRQDEGSSVGQSTSTTEELAEEDLPPIPPHVIDEDTATIVVTDETLGQFRNNLVVRDVQQSTSQNHELILNESYQNLASVINSATMNSVVITETPNINRTAAISTFEPMTTTSTVVTMNPNSSIPLSSSMTVKTSCSNNDDEGCIHPKSNVQSPTSTSSSASMSSGGRRTATTDIDDENDEADDEEDSIQRSPSDLNSLSRLIIQQLPKRIDMLKHENLMLTQELVMNDKILKKTEEELQNQKHLSLLLQNQVEQQNLIEMKLHQELGLQHEIIGELKNEIGNDKECFEKLKSENQLLSNFVQVYKEDRLIQEGRATGKSMKAPNKSCPLCHSKFTFFKKKYDCKICGYEFCSKCSTETIVAVPGTSDTTRMSKGRICSTCQERKQKLESLLTEVAHIQ